MPAIISERNDGKVLEVRVSGKLTHDDYQSLVPVFDRLVSQHGKIRVLFDMADFHGWEVGAIWDDIKFDVKHFADIERLAMVGEKQWEHGMAAFCRPFTTAKLRYFDRRAMQDARSWVTEALHAAQSPAATAR